MADRIDTAKERENLSTISNDVMLMCATCWEESNCHPADEMLIASNGRLYCDACMDIGDDPEPWVAAPDPVDIATRALAAVDAERAKNERLREALKAIEARHPAGSTILTGRDPLWRDSYRDLQRVARAALNPEGKA